MFAIPICKCPDENDTINALPSNDLAWFCCLLRVTIPDLWWIVCAYLQCLLRVTTHGHYELVSDHRSIVYWEWQHIMTDCFSIHFTANDMTQVLHGSRENTYLEYVSLTEPVCPIWSRWHHVMKQSLIKWLSSNKSPSHKIHQAITSDPIVL